SARFLADDRRLFRRLGQRGRRRPRAAGAGIGHQRLHPRAVVVLRNLWLEADLWKAVARALLSVRGEPRSSRPVRPRRSGSPDRLRKRQEEFHPAVRDRFIAGAMVPAVLVDRAQKFRRWYRAKVLELFKSVDVILAPATPCVAPKIGQATFVLDGVELAVRANIGIPTPPISFIGLP